MICTRGLEEMQEMDAFSSHCLMCKENEEAANYLFIHCTAAFKVGDVGVEPYKPDPRIVL